MASAAKKTVTVTKPVQETRVVLELTEEEANFLIALVGTHVSGGHVVTTSIYGALYELGYDFYSTAQAKEFGQKMTGMVHING